MRQFSDPNYLETNGVTPLLVGALRRIIVHDHSIAPKKYVQSEDEKKENGVENLFSFFWIHANRDRVR